MILLSIAYPDIYESKFAFCEREFQIIPAAVVKKRAISSIRTASNTPARIDILTVLDELARPQYPVRQIDKQVQNRRN